jgi:hypothetical protein
MRKVSILIALMLMAPVVAQARTDGALRPSQATRQGQPSSTTASISLNAETIELTLSDAIYLGLRDNRAGQSAMRRHRGFAERRSGQAGI